MLLFSGVHPCQPAAAIYWIAPIAATVRSFVSGRSALGAVSQGRAAFTLRPSDRLWSTGHRANVAVECFQSRRRCAVSKLANPTESQPAEVTRLLSSQIQSTVDAIGCRTHASRIATARRNAARRSRMGIRTNAPRGLREGAVLLRLGAGLQSSFGGMIEQIGRDQLLRHHVRRQHVATCPASLSRAPQLTIASRQSRRMPE